MFLTQGAYRGDGLQQQYKGKSKDLKIRFKQFSVVLCKFSVCQSSVFSIFYYCMHKFQLPYTRIFRRFSIYMGLYQSINQQTERSSEGDTKCVSKIKQQRNNRLYNWIYTGYCIKKELIAFQYRVIYTRLQEYIRVHRKFVRRKSLYTASFMPQKFVPIPQRPKNLYKYHNQPKQKHFRTIFY